MARTEAPDETSRVAGIHTYNGDQKQARAGQSVTLTVADHVDISRGDMIVHSDQLARVDKELDATLCWMGEQPLSVHRRYVLKHTTRVVKAVVSELRHRVDVDTLERQEAQTLRMNDIGRVHLRTQQPLVWDPYEVDRFTGAFILIDDTSHRTVAAGILTGADNSESRGTLG